MLKDKEQIEAIRQSNNEAIKNRNASAVTAPYMDDFFILTSTNDFFSGKKTAEKVFQSVFDLKAPKSDVNFIRSSKNISISANSTTASEYGSWIGTWKHSGALVKVGGDYYAKWRKIDTYWKLQCEVYTQLG